MEDEEEQFTRRMIRRASSKKNGDETSNYNSLQRKLNILKAIESSQSCNGPAIGSGVNNPRNEKDTKEEYEPLFVKNNNGHVKNKNSSFISSFWSRLKTPESNHESKNKFTSEPFFQENNQFFEQKEIFNESEELRTHGEDSELPDIVIHSSSDLNQTSTKNSVSDFSENMQSEKDNNCEIVTELEFNVEKCKIKTETFTISNDRKDKSSHFSSSHSKDSNSSKNELNFPKNLNLSKMSLNFPRPYAGNQTKTLKSTNNKSSSFCETENSNKELSLPSYTRDFDVGEVNWIIPSSTAETRKIEDWEDPSKIFRDNLQKEIAPQLFTVGYKTTPVPEKVMNFEIIDTDSDIKESIPSCPISTQKKVKELDESDTETGSTFSLSSAIKNLDEEIQNLQIRSEAGNQEKLMETPKKLYPSLVTENLSGYTPRKLFRKDIQDPQNHNEKIEDENYRNKIEIKPNSPVVKSSSIKRKNSGIFRFRTPKSWRPKPDCESTRRASNFDLTKKTSPSQVGSTISTITPISPTNSENVEIKSPIILENTIPFEVEQFLEQALGDELYNTSITYGFENRTNSNLNASELISEDKTPPRQNWVPKTPNTEPSRHSTLNRTVTAYKSMSQRIKKKFRPSLKESVKQSWNPYVHINGILDDKLQRLLQELNIQQTLIYQASKALDLCSSMKEFQASPEQVESDRLLLIAHLRKQSLFQEIKSLALKSQAEDFFNQQAEITLKDVSLSLREAVLRRERQSGDVIEWFVVVISQGPTVWATHAIMCPINSPRIYFPGSISFPKMKPDFKITLKVYSMKLQTVVYNHEEKYHIQKEEKYMTCPSPTKLLKRTERPLSPKCHEIKFSGVRESSFVPMGVVDFQLHDISLYSPWPLRIVPKDSVLHGTIDLSLTCKLHLSISHTGFLTHGDEVGGYAVWNRRWCVLEGHTLMFWNYPREEEIKNPLLIIDLMDCVSDQVNTVDRTLCARPRTFVIETARRKNAGDRDSIVLECRPGCTIIRHLFQCDTTHDLIEWMSKLNQILSALREWNVIGVPQPMESDL